MNGRESLFAGRVRDLQQAEDRYLHFAGMTWPNPAALADARWRIVYGTPTRADLLLAASVLGAYSQLVEDTQRRRNEKVAGIRAAMEAQ